MRPVKIDLTTRQMKALELRWSDWEVKVLGLMLGMVLVAGLVGGAFIVRAFAL